MTPTAFEKFPSVLTVESVLKSSREIAAGLPDGRWVPCRCEGWPSLASRVRCAWLVFTGRADALVWERQ